MATLSELLLVEPHHSAMIKDVATMYEAHINQLKGLKGMSLRGGLKMLRAARANAMEEAVGRLIPESLEALDTDYQAWLAEGDSRPTFDVYLGQDPKKLSATILGVVNGRVARSSHAALKSTYGKLRNSIEAEFEAVAPQLVKVIAKHVDAAAPR